MRVVAGHFRAGPVIIKYQQSSEQLTAISLLLPKPIRGFEALRIFQIKEFAVVATPDMLQWARESVYPLGAPFSRDDAECVAAELTTTTGKRALLFASRQEATAVENAVLMWASIRSH